jgi:hypothetical protein
MATQHTLRTADRSRTIAVVGFAALVAAALIGALFMVLRPPATVERAAPPPAASVSAPAVVTDPSQQGVMGYLRAHSLTAPAAAAPAIPGVSNRIFADEIAGASTGVTDWAASDAPNVLPQRGPR